MSIDRMSNAYKNMNRGGVELVRLEPVIEEVAMV